jgi:hypothetical protein
MRDLLMKLYLVHCGYYDLDTCEGVYENHVNFFVAAESFEDAKLRAKQLEDYKKKRMHVDGLQEISAVNGFDVKLQANKSLNGRTLVVESRHRDLAQKLKVES